MKKATLFLADDHQIMIDGLRQLLQEMDNIEVIGIAHDGLETEQQALILKPDLILMDLDMPRQNGYVTAKALHKTLPNTKIVILSMHADQAMVKQLMHLGIAGYLLKNTDKEELQLAIQQVLKGKSYFQAELLNQVVNGRQLQQEVQPMQKLALLSDREQEVLKGIAHGKTSAEIADDLYLSVRTVETHRKNIHQKLHIKNMAGLIRFAIKSGLVQ